MTDTSRVLRVLLFTMLLVATAAALHAQTSTAAHLSGELTFDLFNITNRANISDLNTVCECDLPASAFSPGALKGTIGSLNPLFGFDTARQTLNPFQFQYGFKLRF